LTTPRGYSTPELEKKLDTTLLCLPSMPQRIHKWVQEVRFGYIVTQIAIRWLMKTNVSYGEATVDHQWVTSAFFATLQALLECRDVTEGERKWIENAIPVSERNNIDDIFSELYLHSCLCEDERPLLALCDVRQQFNEEVRS